jgi:hypothetical protein
MRNSAETTRPVQQSHPPGSYFPHFSWYLNKLLQKLQGPMFDGFVFCAARVSVWHICTETVDDRPCHLLDIHVLEHMEG